MVDYDPFSEAILDDPFPVYRALRERSPVHYLPKYDCWALSRFEDIWAAGQDPMSFRSPGPNLLSFELPEGMLPEFSDRASIFAMNPPDHTELRRHLTRHFTPGAVRGLEASAREVVRNALERVLPTGRCDVIGDLAGQLSVRIACMLVGLPVADGDRLVEIVRRFFAREPGVQGMPPSAMHAALELREYLLDAINDRRRSGIGDRDILDMFLSARIADRPFSDEELTGQLTTLVVGGTETLPKVFAGGVLQLSRHPDQRRALANDPSRIPDAFQEIARYEMPTNFLTRTLGRDLEMRGQKLREGQGVLFLFRSANRDAEEFPDPDRFDIHRRPPRILSFGQGTHLCLGQHAARLEARVAYEELLARIPDFEVNEAEVVPARSEFVAGYLEMPIQFEPR